MSKQEQKRDPGSFEDVGRTLDKELKRLLDFVNNRVVPAARDDTEEMLRRAADALHELADRLGGRRQRGGGRGPKK